MKNRKTRRKILLGMAVLMVLVLATAAIFAGSWNIIFTKTAGNSSLGYTAYRSMQGIGFDTYSGKDGYEFVQSDDEKTYALIHFTMDSDGWAAKQKQVVYNATNVGHANDATVYKDDSGKKWLFFAPCGTYSEDNKAKASDGKALALGVIDLSEYNGGTAKTYSCDISAVTAILSSDGSNKGNITGITYTGKQYINGAKVPVFIMKNAREMYEVYLTRTSAGKMVFTPTDPDRRRGRVDKIFLDSGNKVEADAQGITYHNQYLYTSAEKMADGYRTRTVVARISLDTLFDGDRYTYKTMEICDKNITKEGSVTFTKCGPEAVFFTSLNEKSNIYIGVNRAFKSDGKDKDDDAIMRSAVRY